MEIDLNNIINNITIYIQDDKPFHDIIMKYIHNEEIIQSSKNIINEINNPNGNSYIKNMFTDNYINIDYYNKNGEFINIEDNLNVIHEKLQEYKQNTFVSSLFITKFYHFNLNKICPNEKLVIKYNVLLYCFFNNILIDNLTIPFLIHIFHNSNIIHFNDNKSLNLNNYLEIIDLIDNTNNDLNTSAQIVTNSLNDNEYLNMLGEVKPIILKTNMKRYNIDIICKDIPNNINIIKNPEKEFTYTFNITDLVSNEINTYDIDINNCSQYHKILIKSKFDI